MKKGFGLSLLFFYAIWGAFKSAESLIKPVGARDMYSAYGLDVLYYAVTAIIIAGGLALIYAIQKAKPWGYPLGFVWLAVSTFAGVFTSAVLYMNKALATQILTLQYEARGRDTAGIAEFVNSSAYETTTLVTMAILLLLGVFLAFKLYQKRAYFK